MGGRLLRSVGIRRRSESGIPASCLAWAACLPEEEAVIVVLTNHEVDEDMHFAFSHGLARPLVQAMRSD